jgi:hypothetical protein
MQYDREHPGRGYDAEALATSERARARSLLELLAGVTDRNPAGRRSRTPNSGAIHGASTQRQASQTAKTLLPRRSRSLKYPADDLRSLKGLTIAVRRPGIS